MKTIKISLLGLAVTLGSTGCMAVSATDNSRGIRSTQQVIAVGNDVYLIDTKTGGVRKIDLTSAQPFVPATSNESVSVSVEAGSAE